MDKQIRDLDSVLAKLVSFDAAGPSRDLSSLIWWTRKTFWRG